MNADTLKAGRELDAKIAVEVLGWKWASFMGRIAYVLPPAWYDREVGPSGEGLNFVAGRPDGAEWDVDSVRLPRMPIVPEFSTDIAAGWLVVEHMRKQDYIWDFGSDGESGWSVDCFIAKRSRHEPPPNQNSTYADTAPLAICLAALAALDTERTA